MIHYERAETSEDISRLLRRRGRVIITAPAGSGKTTELIRYAEDRYPNGRFLFVAREEDHEKIIRLHWLIYNKMTWAEHVANKLLGKKVDGVDPIIPTVLTPLSATFRVLNASTPVFVDDWHLISPEAQRKILKHRLFIAGVKRESTDASSQEDQNG